MTFGIRNILQNGGNDHAGKARTTSNVNPAFLIFAVMQNLYRICNMAVPYRIRRARPDQIDRICPFCQFTGKDFKPVDSFT
jgi:hypothetical protein